MKHKHSSGYSVIELMVALTIGLVLLLGVMAVFVTSRSTYQASETQARLVDDARFVMESLSSDLRMAGSWGQNSAANMVSNRPGGVQAQGAFLANIADDCAPSWYADVNRRVFATNETNPYNATCLPGSVAWRAGTDILVVRYALPNQVADNAVVPNAVYVRSALGNSVLFRGPATPPAGLPTLVGNNHLLQTHLYYVSDFTETPGDGRPSLHRISLGPGPALTDEMIVPGVEQLQVQFGVDTDTPVDGQANVYVNADNGNYINWNYLNGDGTFNFDNFETTERIRSVRVWVLLRSEEQQQTVTAGDTFDLGGQTVTPNDQYKRLLVSGVFNLRNVQRSGAQQ